MEKTIQSIPITPFAPMYGCISAVIGFFIGIFYAALFGIIFANIPSSTNSILNLGWLGWFLGAGAIILVPIVSFIGGFILAVVVAVVHNFLAPRIGGVRVLFKEEPQPKMQ